MMITKMRLTSDELKVFKKIACEHDAKILSALGFEINGNINIQSACPVHGGDNKTAFSYHLGKCCWSCFTHNCHQKYGNDIIGLCRGLKKMNFQDTIDWIKEVISSDQFEEIKINKEQYNSLHNPLICDKRLKNLDPTHDFIQLRNFSEETCKYFESGVSVSGKTYHHRLMVPIRNISGELVGITGRSIFEKNNDGWYYPSRFTIDDKFKKLFVKWRNYPKGFNKSIEIYNIDKACSSIQSSGIVVIVEGPFDCWRLHSCGLKNTVALLGSSLSISQFNLLQKCGAKTFAIALDSDDAGQAAYQRIKSLYGDKVKISKIFFDKKDPDSLTDDEFNRYITPQINILTK